MEQNFKQTAEQKMSKAISVLKSDFDKIRTGRAHPSILDQINVDYYGTPTPINQVASVTLLDSQTLSVVQFVQVRQHVHRMLFQGLLKR